MPHAVVTVDLAAIEHNVAVLSARTTAQLMAVVKADGYGHGMLPAAHAAIAGGATWLGVATLAESLALRAAGVDVPVFAWLWTLDEHADLAAAVDADIDIGVSTLAQLAAVQNLRRSARVHLKADTGLSRNGATPTAWPGLVAAAAHAAYAQDVEIVGIWSHLACADEPAHPANVAQLATFHVALGTAAAVGVIPAVRHLANSAALLTAPATHFDLVRVGIAAYGLDPAPGRSVGPPPDLRPAMTLRARVANVKRVPAGAGVSYGHTYVTPGPTSLALVPLGYGDGVPRAGSGVGPVSIAGRRATVTGRVCMDQFVVDVGDQAVTEGDEVILFGDGGPTAQEWADAVGTIHYEIVTRIGARVPREYVRGSFGGGSR